VRRGWVLALFLFELGSTNLQAQTQDELDEADLFGDPQGLLVDSTHFTPPDSEETPGLRTGGSLSTATFLNWSRASLHESPANASLSARSVGTLDFDARSPDGSKAFATLEATYRSDSASSSAYLREMFVDFNLSRHLYLRAGKQVLQWGRCYFWNPSDLINVEEKTLVERLGAREGAFGLRLHIPFGTSANLYAFADTRGADEMADLKGSFKAEFLLGDVETSLSLWTRRGLAPALAWDASSALGKWDIAMESVLLPAGFSVRYEERADTLFSQRSKAFAPRAAISLGRFFDVRTQNDRLRVQYEMYYNSLGYAQSPLRDSRTYNFTEPVRYQGIALREGPKILWLYGNDALENYGLGRWYAAFFRV